jgi:hypothetical protein
MRLRLVQTVLTVVFLVSCASRFSGKSADVLDPKTGATLGVMQEPLTFIETGVFDWRVPDKRPSVVYLGPVQWNRGGRFTYGLWVQLAPGESGHLLDKINTRGTVNLKLDDGLVSLAAVDLPKIAGTPYPPQLLVDQTAYFAIDVPTLKRMAATQKIVLNIRAPNLTMVEFAPKHETRSALKQYMYEAGISGD